ncbi:hypothetical protein CFOL_v3_35149, partial [Cephalotus follicularis]
NKTH